MEHVNGDGGRCGDGHLGHGHVPHQRPPQPHGPQRSQREGVSPQ